MTSIASDNATTSAASIPLLYTARALRGFGDGFAIIILPAYLTAIGFDAVAVGLVATASLLGTGAADACDRLDRAALRPARAAAVRRRPDGRRPGLAFPACRALRAGRCWSASSAPSIPRAAISASLVPLEHAMLARSARRRAPHPAFARYSLIGALCAAAGSLAASLPDFLVAAGSTQLGAFRADVLCLCRARRRLRALYRRLPHARG